MKRYYTGLDFILGWLFILLLAIGGFIFECIDRGGFIIFAFITSFLMQFGVEVMLVILFGGYITIDKEHVKRFLFRIQLKKYNWKDIKEIKVVGSYIYISLEKLIGKPREWNKKRYFYVVYSNELWNTLRNNASENIIIDMNPYEK